MTAAAAVAESALASVVARAAPEFALIDALPALAAPAAARAGLSAPEPVFAARARDAAGPVFVPSQRFGLFVEVAVFLLVAVHAGRAFVLPARILFRQPVQRAGKNGKAGFSRTPIFPCKSFSYARF